MKPFFKMMCLLMLGTLTSRSQVCNTCQVLISETSSESYTVNAGETFCVDSIGNFDGSIVLNGGSICNKGIFKPVSITLINGSIQNFGLLTFSSGQVFSTNLTLTNDGEGIVNFVSTLEISGGTLFNAGVCNIKLNFLNTSGTVTNTGILNCDQLVGSNALLNSGTLTTKQN